MANGKVYIKRLIVRSAFLVVAASAIGLIVNAVRTPNVDLFGYKPPKQKIIEAAKPGEKATVSEIDLETALELLKTEGALFVDARKPSEYAEGRIPGAINIPITGFVGLGFNPAEPYLSRLQSAKKVITYCSDKECDEAYELAEQLTRGLGLKISVLVFSGGMKEYQAKGPVER